MINIQYHREFLKEYKKLPKPIQIKLADIEDRFRENPFHPELYTKKLSGKLKHLYSFRITRDYRTIFEFTSNAEVLFLSARHRKDIYRHLT